MCAFEKPPVSIKNVIFICLICSLWRGLGNPPVPWHQPFDHPKRFWSEAELMVELVTWTLGATSGLLVGSTARPTSSRSCGRVGHQNSALFWFRSSSALLGLIQIQPLAIIALKSYRAGVVSWSADLIEGEKRKHHQWQILTKCKFSLCRLLRCAQVFPNSEFHYCLLYFQYALKGASLAQESTYLHCS